MMASPDEAVAVDDATAQNLEQEPHQAEVPMSQPSKSQHAISKTPEPQPERVSSTPSSPSVPSPYNWDDFERRYEEALRDADENEKQILKEAEGLSKVCRPGHPPSLNIVNTVFAVF